MPCLSAKHWLSLQSRRDQCEFVCAGLGLATVPLVFSYIEMLRQAGPQRWVFDELAAVAEQRFRFADDEEASEYVSRLAASLPLYAPEHALNGPHVHEAWRPDLVSTTIDTSLAFLRPYSVPGNYICFYVSCVQSFHLAWSASSGRRSGQVGDLHAGTSM